VNKRFYIKPFYFCIKIHVDKYNMRYALLINFDKKNGFQQQSHIVWISCHIFNIKHFLKRHRIVVMWCTVISVSCYSNAISLRMELKINISLQERSSSPYNHRISVFIWEISLKIRSVEFSFAKIYGKSKK
jgi:hypothetical protein